MKRPTIPQAPDTGLVTPEMIALDVLVIDERVQSREKMNRERVEEYALAFKNGEKFPPIIVFYGGITYWVADGFHRVEAARMAGKTEIMADIRGGDIRKAILYSAGSNTLHGLNRTDADKRRAVGMLLADEEWVRVSNREIARHCRVSEGLVRILKRNARLAKDQECVNTQLNGESTATEKDGRRRPTTAVRLPLNPERACDTIARYFEGEALTSLVRSLAQRAGLTIETESTP